MHTFHSCEPLPLELGGELPQIDIAYHTYGRINEAGDNVIWVCHALTANSDVADWWPHTVEEGKFLDPAHRFVICANILGSHYGTTGPLSIDPATGEPYYDSFPRLTMRDIVSAHRRLADYLGITHIDTLVGCSVGGFQAIEWAVQEPSRFGRMVLIATDAKASPWTIAIDETQRMAIFADSTYGEPSPYAGMKGMAAARAIGLLSYRGPQGYNTAQCDPAGYGLDMQHRACTYQRHQGDKLCRRFNAYSYVSILDSFDTHDVGRGRGGVEAALAAVNIPAMVIGLSTDIIFTPQEMRRLAGCLPQATYAEINSEFGHDGFLVEHDSLNTLLKDFMK